MNTIETIRYAVDVIRQHNPNANWQIIAVGFGADSAVQNGHKLYVMVSGTEHTINI